MMNFFGKQFAGLLRQSLSTSRTTSNIKSHSSKPPTVMMRFFSQKQTMESGWNRALGARKVYQQRISFSTSEKEARSLFEQPEPEGKSSSDEQSSEKSAEKDGSKASDVKTTDEDCLLMDAVPVFTLEQMLLLSDITHATLSTDISHIFNTLYLSDGTLNSDKEDPETKTFRVEGKLVEIIDNQPRIMLNLPVRLVGKEAVRNVFFLLDTGSGSTYLAQKTIEALICDEKHEDYKIKGTNKIDLNSEPYVWNRKNKLELDWKCNPCDIFDNFNREINILHEEVKISVEKFQLNGCDDVNLLGFDFIRQFRKVLIEIEAENDLVIVSFIDYRPRKKPHSGRRESSPREHEHHPKVRQQRGLIGTLLDHFNLKL